MTIPNDDPPDDEKYMTPERYLEGYAEKLDERTNALLRRAEDCGGPTVLAAQVWVLARLACILEDLYLDMWQRED